MQSVPDCCFEAPSRHNDQTEPVVQDGTISYEQLHCNQFKKSIGHYIEVMGWPM